MPRKRKSDVKKEWNAPEKEIVSVKMFRIFIPAFIVICLGIVSIFYAQTRIEQQIMLAPGEGVLEEVPMSWWYWVIGLAIILILLLSALITLIVITSSKKAQKSNSAMKEQAVKIIMTAKKGGYTDAQIREKFQSSGWDEQEVSQMILAASIAK